MLKKLFTNTAIYGLSPYIPRVASLFTLPIVTAHLTAMDYGVAGIIAAYSGAIGVLNTLGLRTVLVNSFYKSPCQYKWLWRQLYGFLTLWLFVYAALFASLLYLIMPAEAGDQTGLIILLNIGPYILFGPAQVLGSTYYQVNEKPIQVATRTVIFGLATVLLNLYTIAYLQMGFMGWFWSEFIVVALYNLSYWVSLNFFLPLRPIFNFKWRTIRSSLKISLPTVPHFYSIYLLNSSDRGIMDLLKVPTASIGKYNLASNFSNYFSAFASASNVAVGPMLNRLFKKNEDLVARSIIFTLQVIFLGATFGFSIWSREIFTVLIKNDDLQQGYPLAIILVMSINYRPMYIGANAKVMFEGRTSVLWRVSAVGGLISVLLNFLLIPHYGIMAAAVVTFVAYMYMGYSGFFFAVFKRYNSINYYPVFWLVITIFLTVLAYLAVNWSLPIKVSLSLVLFAVLGFVYKRYRRFIKIQV